jgi:hypothetical protein
MEWRWHQQRAERPNEPVICDPADDLRLFPILRADRSHPVADLLARGRLEEATELVPDRAWVASVPLYG